MTYVGAAWTANWTRTPGLRVRVFCFPYAGGGTRIFADWPRAVDPAIQICPVMLPGHESRISEPLLTSMDELVPRLARDLLPFMDVPYAMFGHSMGGLIAFALAHHLAGTSRPRSLVLSGCQPHGSPDDPPKHGLTDDEFLAELRRMNGTPTEFFDSPDLVELLLPIIRADFTLSETYTVDAGHTVDVPITALGGVDDHQVKPAGVRSWREHTTGAFEDRVMPGDHFFIHDTARVLPVITAALTR